jgi:hypothetical protein
MLSNSRDINTQKRCEQFEPPPFASIARQRVASPRLAQIHSKQAPPAQRWRKVVAFDVVCIGRIRGDNRHYLAGATVGEIRVNVAIELGILGSGWAAHNDKRLAFLKSAFLASVIAFEIRGISKHDLKFGLDQTLRALCRHKRSWRTIPVELTLQPSRHTLVCSGTT